MKAVKIGMVFVLLLTLATTTLGTTTDSPLGKGPNQPVEITSKRLVAKMVHGGVELTFDGKVKVKQDDMILSCDKMIILYEEEKKGKFDQDNQGKKNPRDITSSIKSAVGSGNVKITKGELTAAAGKAVMDNMKRTVTLTEGPPRIWQGPHLLTAHTIVIYLDENRAELLGGEENGIKATLNPGKQKKEKEK